MTRRVRGFAPLAARDATVLILGSMPGEASLAAGRYYAHPRNAFWPIMAALLEFDAGAAYAARVRALKLSRIALWDVLQSCTRAGSLDADIAQAGLVVNDFAAFFRTHREIRRVYFNGTAAAQYYLRHVAPGLGRPDLACVRLPSTSPAHAALSFRRKLHAWRAVTRG